MNFTIGNKIRNASTARPDGPVRGRLTVVGAGPGDAELITLKGLGVLQRADVVLYDALVDPALLAYAPDAEHIFVGKRKGCYAYSQDQINELIVHRAKTRGHVVRLKGGDPFVFGRGTEELEYAATHGLAVAAVPGISSSVAVPALQDIPVTRRGISESFWVITGTTRDHQLSRDIYLAAQSSATVIILMGMSKLAAISALFAREGKADLPVAVIEQGTLPGEKVVTGTIATIEAEVARKKITNPAVIVVGEVVRCRETLKNIKQNKFAEVLH